MTKTFLRPVTALVAAILAPGLAHAVDFAAGGWNGSFDTTVSFGQSWRQQGRNPELVGTADGGTGRSPNIDDGDLNYKKGRVSSAYKIVAELGLDHGENFGLFVRGSVLYDDMVEDHDEVIVQSTIDLAHNLGLTCVAEGVQDAATLERLAVLGCDSAQGSFISPALDGPGVTEWLRQRAAARQPQPRPKRTTR